MAPEILITASLGYTCAVDWWALGIVMHELVVGPRPFDGDSEDEVGQGCSLPLPSPPAGTKAGGGRSAPQNF